MAIGDSDIVFDASGLADATPFNAAAEGLQAFGVGCRVVSGSWRPTSGGSAGGFVYPVDPEAGPVTVLARIGTAVTAGRYMSLALLDENGDGWAARANYGEYRVRPVTAYVQGAGVTFGSPGSMASGDVYSMTIDGTALTLDKNGSPVDGYTVTAGVYRPALILQDDSGILPIDMFAANGYAPAAPAINPTGTDTNLVNGSSFSIACTGLVSNPVSVSVIWDNGVDTPVSATQASFSLGTVTDGAATITADATIGNLPYTDATYLTADYSYLVTCDDDSEITFDTLTFAPETGNSFITVASPVNDSTSILPSETLVNGQQLEWPDEVVISESNTATLDVLADGQYSIEWSGAAASFTFTLRFWDGAEWFDIATTINTAGEVVSGGGLTRVGLTRIGLTSAGLTSVGLSSAAVTVGLIASTYLTALTEMSNYG